MKKIKNKSKESGLPDVRTSRRPDVRTSDVRTSESRRNVLGPPVNNSGAPPNYYDQKIRKAVYPSRMAPIGPKLWENAFQTIPDVSFFDAEHKNCFGEIFGSEISFFAEKARLLRSHGRTDLKINFLVKFCSR